MHLAMFSLAISGIMFILIFPAEFRFLSPSLSLFLLLALSSLFRDNSDYVKGRIIATKEGTHMRWVIYRSYQRPEA